MSQRAALVIAISIILTGGFFSTSSQASLLAPVSACPNSKAIPNNKAERKRAIRAMHCMHNYAREAAGKDALEFNNNLSISAGLKARDIFRCGVFEHTACGRVFEYWIVKKYTKERTSFYIGENLAYGWGRYRSPRLMMQGWLQSPGHRHNILNSTFQDVGYSLRRGRLKGEFVHLWVAHFGTLY